MKNLKYIIFSFVLLCTGIVNAQHSKYSQHSQTNTFTNDRLQPVKKTTRSTSTNRHYKPAIAQFAKSRYEGKAEVKGVVVDAATGKPLPGISISLTGVVSAMTNDKGEFDIKLPSFNEELNVSGPLRETQIVLVRGKKDLKIQMYEEGYSNSSYKDVLMPFGDVNNTRLTASTTYLNGDYSNNPAYTPEQILQGRVAGLETQMRSGQEGVGGNLYLNGVNSVYGNNQPLLVVDGMVIENEAFGTSLIEGYVSTPLGSIDVHDIQRLTVLKDATALYGVKGANGAIIIETLRSKQMATKITAHVQYGLNLTPHKIPLLSANEAKSYLIDMYQSEGYSASQIQNMGLFNTTLPTEDKWGRWSGNTDYYRYNKSTDWQDAIFNNGVKGQYGLNVTGGDDMAVYALSLGFINNNGLIDGTSFNRFNTRVNSDLNFSPQMKVHVNMSFLYGQKQMRDEACTESTAPIYTALVKAPFMTKYVYNEENVPSPNLEGSDSLGISNPKAIIDDINEKNSNYRFIGNADVDYALSNDLKLSTNFGIDFNKERETIFYPSTGIKYPSVSSTEVINSSRSRVERLFAVFSETRLNYKHEFDRFHKIDATAGFRYMSTHSEEDWGKAYNSASDKLTTLGDGDNALRQTGGTLGNWKWAAMYINADYSILNKYFFSGILSMDASSRYGTKVSKFQPFPSLQASWLISSENFMKNINWINLLKLRVGYTITGNDDMGGNYAGRRYYTEINYYGNEGLIRGNIVDDHLKPELNKKFDVGVDWSMFNDRLSLSVDYYYNNINNLITNGTPPTISGFSTYITNGGSMRNAGLDIAVKGRIINSALTWDLGINATFNKNKVTKLESGAYNTDAYDGEVRTQVGQPIGIFYGYKTNGIYETTAEATSAGLKTMIGTVATPFQAGDVRFVNTNGDSAGLIDKNDMVKIGDPNPDVFGGITSTIKYKRLMLDALFTYSIGNDIYNYTRRILESESGYENQTKAVRNRWSVEGQNTSMPKAEYGDPRGNSRFSDRWIENGSYLKLKTLSLSYVVPIKEGLLTGLTVYGAAENLFTVTKYKGYDPEIATSLNPLARGIDAFICPTVATFYFGVKFGL